MSTQQDYTVYVEVDAPGRISPAQRVVAITDLDGDENSRLHYDFGASYFSGDFEHILDFTCTLDTNGYCCLWALTNVVGTIGTLVTAGTNHLLALYWDGTELTLLEENAGSQTTDTTTTGMTISTDTKYYLRIVRDEATTTLYCYIYSDPQYTTRLDKLSITLSELVDFQYLFAASGEGDGGSGESWSGTINNLSLDPNPYTLANLRTRIRDLLDEDYSTTVEMFWSNTEINQWIKDGEQDIAEKALCIRNIDTVSTTTDVRKTQYSGYKVMFMEYSGFGLRKAIPQQLGRLQITGNTPQRWFDLNDGVYVEPIPDAIYSLNLYLCDYITNALSDDPDIPELPPVFRPLVILFAIHKALYKEKRYQHAEQIESMYNMELAHTIVDKLEPEHLSREGIQDN